MYRKLNDVTLKSGEAAELGVLLGPDDSELAQKLRGLLGHKGSIWKWQIEQSIAKPGNGAESRFFILSKSGVPFANIMLVESLGVGIFGHVYTVPHERRKGAAEILQDALLGNFKQRGGKALYLGTEFDTPPWHIYARKGFVPVEPRSGYMCWFAQDKAAFEKHFSPCPVGLEPLAFKHWPVLPALATTEHPARIRIVTMDVIGPRSTEGGALPILAAMAGAELPHSQQHAAAWVATSVLSQIPVAIACIQPDPRFWNNTDVVDLFAAPGFEREMSHLFQKLPLRTGRTLLSYADQRWPAKQSALKACGFALVATIKGMAAPGEETEIWSRET